MNRGERGLPSSRATRSDASDRRSMGLLAHAPGAIGLYAIEIFGVQASVLRN